LYFKNHVILNQGNLSHYGCTGQNEDVSFATIAISETGIYNLSIARDWGLSAGFEGIYKLTIISDVLFEEAAAFIQDSEVVSYERECL